MSDKEIKMRVWERGTGETLGCGTGACAAAVGSVLNGFTGREVIVAQGGGKVEVEWDKKNNHIYLTGTAEVVYKGEIVI